MTFSKAYISDCCEALSMTPVDDIMKNCVVGICSACRDKATFTKDKDNTKI